MRGHRFLLSGLLTLAAFFLSACSNQPAAQEPDSSIVVFAEQHGSGNLRLATGRSIRVWAQRNGGTAREILAKCRALQNVDATWGETTEGHLCLAVQQQSFFGFVDLEAAR